MFNQAFENWWSSYWKQEMQPNCINQMFAEVAYNAWNATFNFESFDVWWDIFWVKIQPEILNQMFAEVARSAWDACVVITEV